MTTFGDNLRLLRRQHKLTQQQLAIAVGLSERSKGYISELESGKKVPTMRLVMDVAHLFNVSIDALLGDPQLTRIAEQIEKDREQS